ncbi:MAG: PqqD family protein [Sphingomonas sp.]
MASLGEFFNMVAMEAVIARNGSVLDANVGDETVLMSVDTGEYYALTATSREIWNRLDTPISVRDLCRALADAYGAPVETVTADTLAFLDYLERRNMLKIGD